MKIKNNNPSLIFHSWRGLVILALLLLSFGNRQSMIGQNNALILNGAYIILDGGTQANNIYMVVDQANTTGITRPGGGHINSEGQYNFVKWVSGTNTGNYVFPFGVGGTAADYIPFTFNKTTSGSSDIGMSTWTTNQQNMPHPSLSNVGAVTNMTGVPDSVVNAIDRFWDIQTPNATGDLTFSYRGSENTTMFPADTFKAQHWNGTSWDIQAGPGNPGVVAGIGTVGPILGQTTFSPWVLDRIALKATVAGQNSVCGNQCTASATVTPQYGVSAYSYLWDDGQITPVAVGLCQGPHTCTVTDNIHATTTVSVSVISNPIPVINTVSGSQTACAGTNVNAINFSVTPAGSGVNWTNNNTNVGIASSGTVNINGYTAPNVAVTETGTVTATPVDLTTGCTGTSENYTITVNPAPTIVGTPTLSSANCGATTGGVIGLTANGGTPAYTYNWTNGTGTTIGTAADLTNVPVGNYSLTITDANFCSVGSTTNFSVTGSAPITASFTPSATSGQAPLNIVFTNNSTGATTYTWTFDGSGGTSSATNPNFTYNNGGTYTVILTASNANCSETATVTIVLDDATSIIIPNIFSPNGDLLNDEFIITCTGMKSLHCDIFNRWGQQVYTLSAINQTWDGRLNNGNQATEGTYYYMLNATGIDGKTYTYQGPLTLVK
jgi:gliding motility-associated-like protein